MGVEPTMADLQSAALATWLRSQNRINRQTGFSGVSLAGQDGYSFEAFQWTLEENRFSMAQRSRYGPPRHSDRQ